MNIPFVSIIVPIYNVEEYLRECIESIISQTLKNIEIICINDGSTDRSLSILEEYALIDERIIVINKPNTGYGNTMNIGLKRAKGKYVGIVESDDFADPEMFEKLYKAANDSDAEVVKSNYIAYRRIDKLEKEIMDILGECQYNYAFSPINNQNIFFVPASIWSGVYKREFLIENDIFFNETPGASYQDISFAFKVWACAKKVFLIKDAFLHYRIDNMNSSVRSSKKIFCVCDEYKEIEKFLIQNFVKNSELNSLKFVMKYRTYKENYNRLASAFQYAFLMKMSSDLKSDYESGYLERKHWTELEINELKYIINDPDKYFKETAKDYKDDRLMTSPTLNLQFYTQGFFAYISQYNNIIIYGAGIIGKIVAKELKEEGKSIFCFAVSDITKNPEFVLDIPVQSIDELTKYVEDSIILVATKERDQYDIISNLKKLGFKNIVSIDSLLLSGLSKEK